MLKSDGHYSAALLFEVPERNDLTKLMIIIFCLLELFSEGEHEQLPT